MDKANGQSPCGNKRDGFTKERAENDCAFFDDIGSLKNALKKMLQKL